MNNNFTDVIIIGGGHAGLCASYYLSQKGLSHLVFEKGRIGETWRTQRWNSFTMNTANKLNGLPGYPYITEDPDGFGGAGRFVSFLEDYVKHFNLPVKENTSVVSVERSENANFFIVTVLENRRHVTYSAKQVIVASGKMNCIEVPGFSGNISSRIRQMHTSQYRCPEELPAGAVLVVGSGQSGCQIAEDLLDSGRKVYLSTSAVARAPRRYRGKDIMDWLFQCGFMDFRTSEASPEILSMKVPQLTGINNGHTISLQYLAGKGAVILGRMENAGNHHFYFAPDARDNVKFGDQFSKKIKSMIDAFISSQEITAPGAEPDDADLPDEEASCASLITSLSLKEHEIGTVIWTTGFTGDFKFLKLPVLNIKGMPVHKNGITNEPGLYFLGLTWLRSRKSSLICGTQEDAEFICNEVFKYDEANLRALPAKSV